LETPREIFLIARKMSDEPTTMPIIRKRRTIETTFADDVAVATALIVNCDADDAGSGASVSVGATKANVLV
jgi:hypothetical protein